MRLFARQPLMFTEAEAMRLLPKKGPLAIIVLQLMLMTWLVFVTVGTELLNQLGPRRRHGPRNLGSRCLQLSPFAFAESLRRAAMLSLALLLFASVLAVMLMMVKKRRLTAMKEGMVMTVILFASPALAPAAEPLDQLGPGRGRRRRQPPLGLVVRPLGAPFPTHMGLFIVPAIITSGPFVAGGAIDIITNNTYSVMKVMM